MDLMFRISARFLLFSFSSFLLLQPEAGAASVQGLLPDTSGRLESAVVSVNSARRSTLRNASLITNIVNALPDYTDIKIVTNDRAAFTVARNRLPERVGFVEVASENPITIWPQDPFLVLNDVNHGQYLLKPKSFERSGDAVMAEEIAASAGMRVVQSSLYFEGGNIVSDEDAVFIGANTIRRNAVELEINEIEVVKKFERELGRRVLVVGPFPQPSAHIDMFITPLGGNSLLVADAGLGAEIIQRLLTTTPTAVKRFEQTNELNFFGNPMISAVPGEKGEMLTAPELDGKTAEMLELSKEVAPILDGIAGGFSDFGYKVYRVPFLYGGPEAVTDEEAESGQKAAYPMLTYNNVLIESVGEDKTVYLPAYGLSVLDEAARDVWEKLGYKVRTVQGLSISSMYGGALRCSVKVLARKDKHKAQ